jgi:ABC-2 type transport system permease protein
MTDNTGAVYDLGYEPYEGDRRGRSGARRTLVADGVRKVLGFRRKARRKIMPFTLVAIAVIPAIVFVGVGFIVPGAAAESGLSTLNSDMFVIGGTMAMLFTALAAPELLVPDRVDGVLSMLSSRPLTPIDYVASRFIAIVAVVGGFLVLPQVVLYIGQAGTDPEGIINGIGEHADNLPRILLATFAYTMAFVPIGFAIAGYSKRKAIASSIYIAVMLGLSILGDVIVRQADIAGGRWVALIVPFDAANDVARWTFGRPSEQDSLLAAAGIEPVAALVALVVMGVASMALVFHRYRRLM